MRYLLRWFLQKFWLIKSSINLNAHTLINNLIQAMATLNTFWSAFELWTLWQFICGYVRGVVCLYLSFVSCYATLYLNMLPSGQSHLATDSDKWSKFFAEQWNCQTLFFKSNILAMWLYNPHCNWSFVRQSCGVELRKSNQFKCRHSFVPIQSTLSSAAVEAARNWLHSLSSGRSFEDEIVVVKMVMVDDSLVARHYYWCINKL